MRDYLNYAENESKELGYTMDGVRVYLGAHATGTTTFYDYVLKLAGIHYSE